MIDQIALPLTRYNNTDAWADSPVGRLNAKTNGAIWVEEPKILTSKIWRVTDMWYMDENSPITRFHVYGEKEEHLGNAYIGVTWDGCTDSMQRYVRYASSRYMHVVLGNEFPTPNTAGYSAEVLNDHYASERAHFGMFKQGEKHENLMIVFRLFPVNPALYPNDFEV